jgi:non-ribosomal peptide synthetase component F
MSATIPDRSRSDPDIAAYLRTLRAMHTNPEAGEAAHLRALLARLRRSYDDLADTCAGIELALQDSARELARQDSQIAHLTALTLHQTQSILDLRAERAELLALLDGRGLGGWAL